MRTLPTLAASALLTFTVITAAHAQQPGTSPDPHHPPGSSAAPTTPAPSTKGAMPMEMCMRMMSDMGMPSMSGAAADPNDKAAMLQMRAEMMKAMADVMLKHAQRMQGMPGR